MSAFVGSSHVRLDSIRLDSKTRCFDLQSGSKRVLCCKLESTVSLNSTQTRRDLLRNTLSSLILTAAAPSMLYLSPKVALAQESNAFQFDLPPLPYDYTALEPFIDQQTMKLHHDKHHAAYTTKLNATILKLDRSLFQTEGPNAAEKNLKTLKKLLNAGNLGQLQDKAAANSIRNNGGGYINHLVFFETMCSPKSGMNSISKDSVLWKEAVKSFGSFENLQSEMKTCAKGVFGSGWAWLYYDTKSKKLSVDGYSNQDSPLRDSESNELLCGIDVWEHAYYLKYQNRRPEYVDSIMNVLNWNAIDQRLQNVI
eukprot:CAMPEP_0182443410 /NCGR_PEP_ID=MMETSP1172-20130603/2150_1 /TAXON_ID=708627 /ORGANISM="Timspurckia oligopyrenoides, Strain CCMP3278" /LENGTH=310 /DNA_ID=CAMNT_0024638675 /DNA_START=34 /DNA_END=966 /DNA_ORIENTATION=+